MRNAVGVLLLLVALAVGLGGCGSKEEDAVEVADPTAEALAHAPAGAAVLAVVATEFGGGPGAQLGELVGRFPGGSLVAGQGRTLLLDRLGLDAGTDLEPLLGEPLVAWSADGDLATLQTAWVVQDAGKLGDVLDDQVERGALAKAGSVGDQELFTRRQGGVVARRGPVLVTAPDLATLRATLERRAARRDRWTPALLEERGLGLPRGAVARVLLDARALVARQGGSAKRVPWVSALRRAALTVTPLGGGLRVHARATTAPGLAAEDVPLAAGVEPPRTRGSGPVVVGVRGPRQTLAFARAATDLLDPQRLDGLRQAERLLGRYAGVSLQQDVLDRLTGTATLTSRDGRRVTVRSDLDDPQRVEDALGRIGRLARFGGPLANLAGVDLDGFAVGEDDGRYTLSQDGRLLVALKLVDGALVASNDPGADLDASGRAAPGPSAPPAGALRATVASSLLVREALTRFGLPSLLNAVLAPLGDAVVTARGERDHLDAQLVLPVRG